MIPEKKDRLSNILRIPCEIFSRIVGYYRPVNQWNVGKQEEFKERIAYKIEKLEPETETEEHYKD